MSDYVSISPVMCFLSLGGMIALACHVVVRSFVKIYLTCESAFSNCRRTGHDAARFLLGHLGLQAVAIEDGATIDHFDMWRNHVKLRTQTSVSSSIAALAIAAHEVGHAAQFAEKSLLARLTRWLHIGLFLGVGLILFVTLLSAQVGNHFALSLLLFASAAAWCRCPIVLGLEADASKRAVDMLKKLGLCSQCELDQIDVFLRGAFRTHVAINIAAVALTTTAAMLYWFFGYGPQAPSFQQIVEVQASNNRPLFDAKELREAMQAELWQWGLLNLASVAVVAWAWRAKSRTKAAEQSAIGLNNQALALYHKGDFERALSMVDKALDKEPALPAGHYNRAVILTFLGKTDLAIASIERLFASDSKAATPLQELSDSRLLRGSLLSEKGDYLAAIEDFTAALGCKHPDVAAIKRNRGFAYLKAGMFQESLEDINDALRIAPEDGVTLNNRGVALRELGRREEARADFLRAIELAPDLPNPREHLAKLDEAGQLAAAGL